MRAVRLVTAGVVASLCFSLAGAGSSMVEADRLAGPPPGGVTGKVMNSRGEPVPGARVTLRRGELSWTTETDQEGLYCFCRVKTARDYTLLVAKDGFAGVMENDFNVSGRKLSVRNLILRPEGDFSPSPEKGAGGD